MTIHPVLAGIIPSIFAGLLFWFVMRAVLRADRNEREALARADAQAAAATASTASTPEDPEKGQTSAT